MSERRPGVPRLRHGVGVGVGHVCVEGTVHGPIVSRSHASRPKSWQKKDQIWYTTGWESRSLRRATRCVDAREKATRRLCDDDALASMPATCTPGWLPGVPYAALLHGRLQLSSVTTAMLDTLALSHTRLCHHTESVQQQPTATIIHGVQWMQRSGNHCQSL
jgi:hypothetical protein